jgi:SepF-like predicted cell division protein (DUF552 family)
MKFSLRKESDELLQSAFDTLGISKDKNGFTIVQNYMIKKYDFKALDQVEDIKKQLRSRKILIINARELLESQTLTIEELKSAIDQIKAVLSEIGGSLGRIGDQFLILTPNSHIKIAN